MVSLARTVASFYWQFTGVLNQDVPLDNQGRPTEFARYVDYFIERKPDFQGDLSGSLKEMAVQTYLGALHNGEETRTEIRRASWKASVLTRRSKTLASLDLSKLNTSGHTSCNLVNLLRDSPYTVRDIVEALLLENGTSLIEHILGGTAGKQLLEAQNVSVEAAETAALACPLPASPLEEWAVLLQRFIMCNTACVPEAEANHQIAALRAASGRLLRPAREAGVGSRIRDYAEAFGDAASIWAGLVRVYPVRAMKVLIREIRAAPRLIPSAVFLITNTALFIWVVGTAILEIQSIWGVIAISASIIASLWFTDAVTYAVHLDRDGWGDSTVARAFQDHHDVPDEVGLWTVRRSIGTTGMIILIPMTLLAFTQPHFTLAAGIAVFLMGILFATQTHRWAHAPSAHIPGWVSSLQRAHLMISAEAHAVHHDNLDRSWGIFNGWSNSFLDKIGYHEKYTRFRLHLFGEVRPLWESQIRARSVQGASKD